VLVTMGNNGGDAVVDGVAFTVELHAPNPADVTARTRTVYVVPFNNPVTVVDVPDVKRPVQVTHKGETSTT
jgi:hypothetical protein